MWPSARSNAASRIAAAVAQVGGVGTSAANEAAVLVWGRLLGVPDPGSAAGEREVARCLALLQMQVERLRRHMLDAGRRPSAFQPILGRVEALFSVKLLGTNWANTMSQLSPELPSSLELLAEMEPEESEEPISIDALQALRGEINELFSKIDQNTELPAAAKRFLLDQLDILRHAIRDYSLVGFEAFREGVVVASSTWVARADDIAGMETRAEVAQVKAFWPRVEKVAKRTILIGTAVGTLLGGVEKLLGIGKPVLALPAAIDTDTSPSEASASSDDPPVADLDRVP